MTAPPEKPVRRWWEAHRAGVRLCCVAFMAAAAAGRMGYEFWRLTLDRSFKGAIDLRITRDLVLRWFEGVPVYAHYQEAVHMPATYLMMWPLLGWMDVSASRWFWSAITVVMIVWLSLIVVRGCEAQSGITKVFAALLVPSMYATAITVGGGQHILMVLPPLVSGLLLLSGGKPNLGKDVLAAVLLTFTLLKPTVSAPFLWIALFVPGRIRPLLMVLGGYGLLTAFSLLFQDEGLRFLAAAWNSRAAALAASAGYGNIQLWLSVLRLDGLIVPASFLTALLLGVWVHRYRKEQVWLLLGVCALVARFWSYHQLYDDLLVLLPLVALYRIAVDEDSREAEAVPAAMLFGACLAGMLAPGTILLAEHLWGTIFRALQVAVWSATLIFLLVLPSRQEGRAGKAPADAVA